MIIYAAWLIVLCAIFYLWDHVHGTFVLPVFEVATPFFIAFVLAFFVDPLVDKLQSKGMSRGAGIGIVAAFILIVFGAFIVTIVPVMASQAIELGKQLPAYLEEATVAIDALMESNQGLLATFDLPSSIEEVYAKFEGQARDATASAFSVAGGLMSAFLSRIFWVVIIPIATIWFVKDLDCMKEKALLFLPVNRRQKAMEVSATVGDVFRKYVGGMLVVALIYSAVSCILLTILGVPYSLILGAFSGLLYLVPYVGVLITAVLASLLYYAGADGTSVMAIVIFASVCVQSFVVFDLLVTPKVAGGSVGVHPLLALFSIALGAKLMGVIGLVVAVPIAASVQAVIGVTCPGIYEKGLGFQKEEQTIRGTE